MMAPWCEELVGRQWGRLVALQHCRARPMQCEIAKMPLQSLAQNADLGCTADQASLSWMSCIVEEPEPDDEPELDKKTLNYFSPGAHISNPGRSTLIHPVAGWASSKPLLPLYRASLPTGTHQKLVISTPSLFELFHCRTWTKNK